MDTIMKSETYNFEIRTLVAQFVDAFDDVVIRRYNNAAEREIQDKIKCNWVYAPKTRVIHDLVNKAKHIKPPIISVSIANMSRNVNRVFNKIEGPYYDLGPNDTGFSSPLQPVPVDITVNMSIITRFQSDMDQIITNFAPYNDPYIVVSWKAPYTDHEIRSIVKWSGDISFEYPKDIAPTQSYRMIANTNFVIEGWLFKDASEQVGKIYNIDTSFTALRDLEEYEAMLADTTTDNTDFFYLSGQPQVRTANPSLMIPCVTGTEITVDGTWYDTLCSLYVSGTQGVFPDMTLYNPASGNSAISALYPAFSGVEISTWTANTDSSMTFTMPQAVSAGYIDIIAFNEAGYGVLTEDAVRPTLNPYVSGTSEYDNYVEWQSPSVSGVQVAPFYYHCN
tara:strand:- start:11196 stop:12374 length:1179 start_codon:yes stop_codon:yes gene_type:complete